VEITVDIREIVGGLIVLWKNGDDVSIFVLGIGSYGCFITSFNII